MIKTFGFSALAASVALVAAAPAMAQDSAVDGTWDTVMTTPVGDFASSWTFASDDGAHTLSIVDAPGGPGGEGGEASAESITELVVEGDSFSYTRVLDSAQGPVELSITGVVDGDAVSGEAGSQFGAFAFEGVRGGEGAE